MVRVRNALNPLLWTTSIVFPTGLIAAYAFRDDLTIKYVLALVACAPVPATFVAYFIFLFRDPDRLQSEEYILRQQALQIVYHKDLGADVVKVVDEPSSSKSRRDMEELR